MGFSFLSNINYLAVAVSSVIFFVLGSVWFSALFGTMWVAELENHNVTIEQPTSNDLFLKMALTFIANCMASFAMACLVIMTGSTTVATGLVLGIIASLGFVVVSIGSVFIWENRSLKLFLIDVGYPVLGILVAAVLLSVWR